MRAGSRSVIEALRRRPSLAPKSEASRRPPAPPPTIRTRCSDGSSVDGVSAMVWKGGFGMTREIVRQRQTKWQSPVQSSVYLGIVDRNAHHRIDRLLPRPAFDRAHRIGIAGLPARADA